MKGGPIEWETIPNTEDGHREYLKRLGLDGLIDLHESIKNKDELDPYYAHEKYQNDPLVHMFMDIYIRKCLVALEAPHAPED